MEARTQEAFWRGGGNEHAQIFKSPVSETIVARTLDLYINAAVATLELQHLKDLFKLL